MVKHYGTIEVVVTTTEVRLAHRTSNTEVIPEAAAFGKGKGKMKVVSMVRKGGSNLRYCCERLIMCPCTIASVSMRKLKNTQH